MITYLRAGLACACFLSINAAQAALVPIAETPANDLLDAATGLSWIKTTSLQEGLDQGYRLATVDEAKALDYKASKLIDGVFALGTNLNRSVRVNDYYSFTDMVSMGVVAGEGGQSSLAGYASSIMVSLEVPYSYYDPINMVTVYPPSYTKTTVKNYLLVGEPALFEPIAGPLAFITTSRILNSDGTYGEACPAIGCIESIWRVPGSDLQSLGYFMVKPIGVVPEPANVLMMGLGLVALGVVRRRGQA